MLELLTVLSAEPFDGAQEAVVELRRPPESRVLGPDIGAHRRVAVGLPVVFLLHRAIVVVASFFRAPMIVAHHLANFPGHMRYMRWISS